MNAAVNISTIQYKSEQILLYMLIISVCSLAGLYFYFLSASIVHVVISKEAEEKMHKLNSEIATLEAAYMEKQHSISMEIVGRQGYIASGKKVFIDRSDVSVVTRR